MARIVDHGEHDSGWGSWSLTRAVPEPALQADVIELQGYHERGGPPVVRRQTPVAMVPVILVLGAGFRLAPGAGAPPEGWRPLRRSFVAGLHQRSVLVGSAGAAECVEIDLAPLGARRLFGIDLDAIGDAVVDLDALIGPEAERLADAAASAQGWPARFAVVEAWLRARLQVAPAPPPAIAAAWSRLRASDGAAPIGALAAAAGRSRQAFGRAFAREIGLAPKRAARVLRLERALAGLGDPAQPLAQVALAAGYADQAHFTRDVRAFCGETPRALRARLLPGGGLMAEA
jgi:AraC-like DNA-binding protein